MFNFGLVELLIVLGLVWFAFRGYIRRRFPNLHRGFNFVFFATAILVLVFGLVARYH